MAVVMQSQQQVNPLAQMLLEESRAFDDVLYFVKNILGIDLHPPKQKILKEFYESGKRLVISDKEFIVI